jgi:16S rRNA (cytidine1402-2'-O)-methyltransferase
MMRKIVLVPTPLGNLNDMTYRAVQVLKESTLILAEDTRTTGNLLKHFGIETRMRAYHQHNEHLDTQRILDRMTEGEIYALVTDAGTPGISDPGFMLVRAALERGIAIECLPGPVAFVPALVASGLPCDRFHFEGFLPHKKGRQTRIRELAEYPHTVVLYESPHRVLKTLLQFSEHVEEERRCVVAREISKFYEEFVRGTVHELIAYYTDREVKGEVVMMIAGKA